jgi:membrane protease YdiL (CAAX protease family)
VRPAASGQCNDTLHYFANYRDDHASGPRRRGPTPRAADEGDVRMEPIRRYPTVVFFTLAYGIAWFFWGLDIALGGAAQGLITVGMFGPLLAALIVVGVTEGRGGVGAFLGRFRRWRAEGRLYALALFGPFLLAFGATLLDMLTGGPAPSLARQLPAGEPQGTIIVILPVLFVFGLLFGGPLGEEAGWRGFALPRFLTGFGPWTASTLLGLIWGFWYIPLFLIPGTPQAALSSGAYFFWTIGLSYLFTRFYTASGGNLPLMLVLRTAINVSAALLVLPAGDLLSARPFLLHIALVWLLCLVLTVTARSGRKTTPDTAVPVTTRPDGTEAAP